MTRLLAASFTLLILVGCDPPPLPASPPIPGVKFRVENLDEYRNRYLITIEQDGVRHVFLESGQSNGRALIRVSETRIAP